jgi:hypothetical protein
MHVDGERSFRDLGLARELFCALRSSPQTIQPSKVRHRKTDPSSQRTDKHFLTDAELQKWNAAIDQSQGCGFPDKVPRTASSCPVQCSGARSTHETNLIGLLPIECLRVQFSGGTQAIAAPSGEDNGAQLFAQTCTLRIRQSHSLDFSNEGSTSPLWAVAIRALNNFHRLARAAGPK